MSEFGCGLRQPDGDGAVVPGCRPFAASVGSGSLGPGVRQRSAGIAAERADDALPLAKWSLGSQYYRGRMFLACSPEHRRQADGEKRRRKACGRGSFVLKIGFWEGHVKGLPFFLIGPARSGTTYLQRLLDAHPQILLTNESAVFLQLAEMIDKSRIGVRAGLLFGKEYHELWADVLWEQARGLVEDYYRRVATSEGKEEITFWGDKHPHYCNCLTFITQLYPEARFLFCTRDPRDVALSLSRMNQVSVEQAIFDASVFFRRYAEFFEEPGRSWPPIVHYERLITEPKAVLEGILEQLGLPWAESLDAALGRWKDRDAHGLAPDAVDFSNNAGKWRGAFTASQVRLAKELVGPFVEMFSYQW